MQLDPSEVSADQARETADRVLSGRAYVEAARPPSLRERIFDWIGDLFSEIFGLLSSTGGRGIVAWVVIGIFVALTLFFLSRLVGNMGTLPKREAEPGPTIDIAGDLSAKEWLKRAEESERDGDWRAGIRCRHRALVATLAEREWISARPGQTAGEISNALGAAQPHIGAPMTEATYLFKDVWYGWIEAGPAERDRFITLSQTILASRPEDRADAEAVLV